MREYEFVYGAVKPADKARFRARCYRACVLIKIKGARCIMCALDDPNLLDRAIRHCGVTVLRRESVLSFSLGLFDVAARVWL